MSKVSKSKLLRVRRVHWMRFIVAVACMAAGAFSVTATDIFPIDRVTPGSIGVGYTVVQGKKIEAFDVEIIHLLPGAGPAGDLIMVYVSGDPIDRAGGIAAGMSGSPIYVDGQLLGAIGYAYRQADPQVGLVTPATDMMKVLALVESASGQEVARGQKVVQTQDATLTYDTIRDDRIVPLAAPMAIGGFGPRSGRWLTALLQQRGNPVYAGASAFGVGGVGSVRGNSNGSGFVSEPTEMAPGAAIAVQLVRGDVQVGAIGTVTAIEDDGFVAFGHTMSSLGPVAAIATDVSIARTVASADMPFKVGVMGDPIGMVRQDRQAAIAGRFGVFPDTIRLQVTVKDDDRHIEQQFVADVIDWADLTVALLTVSALEAFDRGIDRMGEGTATVTFSVSGEGLPRTMRRSNTFYSATDIAGRALWEVYDALRRLQGNLHAAPELREIVVDIDVSSQRETAMIEKVTPLTKRVAPGDEVAIDVTLRPFRSSSFVRTISVTIPEDAAPGPLTVTVRGGEQPFPLDLSAILDDGADASDHGGDWDEWDEVGVDGLDRLIDSLESQPRNNEIVTEFFPLLQGKSDEQIAPELGGDDPAFGSSGRGGGNGFFQLPFTTVQNFHATDYVIHGLLSFELFVSEATEGDDGSAKTDPFNFPERNYGDPEWLRPS